MGVTGAASIALGAPHARARARVGRCYGATAWRLTVGERMRFAVNSVASHVCALITTVDTKGQTTMLPPKGRYGYNSHGHAERMRRIRAAIREGYAWPGGYALIVHYDGADMCAKCARESYRDISSWDRYSRDGVFVWNGSETDYHTPCDNCGDELSAYVDGLCYCPECGFTTDTELALCNNCAKHAHEVA